MNTTISYIPNGDADRAIWMSNFNVKLPVYAALTGITASELASVQDDTNMYQYVPIYFKHARNLQTNRK